MRLQATEQEGVFIVSKTARSVLITGVVILVVAAAVVILGSGRELQGSYLVYIGIAISTIGLWCLVYREMKIDKPAGDLTILWRLGPIKWLRKQRLDRYCQVRMTPKVVHSQHGTQTYFVVGLVETDNSRKRQHMATLNTHEKARKLGEDIAKTLEFPLADATGKTEVIRQHDQLKASLREQAMASDEALEILNAPASKRLSLDLEGADVVLEIGASGLTWLHWLCIVVLIAPAIALTVFSIQPLSGVISPQLARQILMWISIPELIAVALVVRHSRFTCRVVLNKHGIEVTQSRVFSTETASLSADKVEEIAVGDRNKVGPRGVGGANCIIVIADNERIVFGATLSAKEASYAAKLVRTVLAAPL